MRVHRLDGAEAGRAARSLRALAASDVDVAGGVRAIVEDVRARGDAALAEYVARFDAVPAGSSARVAEDELDAALDALDPAVRAGLEVAIANVRAVAAAGLDGGHAELPGGRTVTGPAPGARRARSTTLAQGQVVTLRELPVRRAAIYVPGGRAPYPSTVVMGVVTARTAGVEHVAVCAPGSHPVILAACALTGAREVWRMGGAHAVAAFALGTDAVERADVIAGPGGPWVQEAKRQLAGEVGIDGYLGPSDVCVLAAEDADPVLVAADLLAQLEHGEGSISVAASTSTTLLDAVADELDRAPDTGAVAATVHVDGPEQALAFAEAFAPEHLELVGPAMEALEGRVRNAGVVFVGAEGATAFGDYVAGSNHSLPTEGTARFASALSVRTFRRQVTTVRIGDAAPALARAAAPVARAEGFEQHARSMELRDNGRR